MIAAATRISGALHTDPAELDALAAEWDALAVAVGAPFGAPAWGRAWFAHLAPAGARLAVVSARDEERLRGVAPFYAVQRAGVTRLRLLSGGFASRLGLLAVEGDEEAVAGAVAATLAASDLRPDLLQWEAVQESEPWPRLLAAGWPGARGHKIVRESTRSAPVVNLEAESFDAWMAAKSRNFRSQMGRRRRAIEGKGGKFRATGAGTLVDDIDAFVRLHTSRWSDRGGSAAVREGTGAMLREVGRELVSSGRFRMVVIDGPDGPVSAQIFIGAGNEVAYWNGGFEETWGEHSPGSVAVLAALEECFERGDRRLDLGGGEASYKDRLADEDLPVAWLNGFPRGSRYVAARLTQLPATAARSGSKVLRRHLGQERYNKLRGVVTGTR